MLQALVQGLQLGVVHASPLDAAVAVLVNAQQPPPQLGDFLRERLRRVVLGYHVHVLDEHLFVESINVNLRGGGDRG